MTETAQELARGSDQRPGDRDMLLKLQAETFDYFARQVSSTTGLIADSSKPGSPASIAAVGLGLTADTVAVERGLMSRDDAVARTLTVLRFFSRSEQSALPHATGYKGFYYHFLDMSTGGRAGTCELSTIDTALLMAGILTVAMYFRSDTDDEAEIRSLADSLYRRVDWAWAADERGAIGHGWTPEHGRLPYAWDKGYSEASILYVLALGSPTFPIAAEGYRSWSSTFELKTFYGIDYLYGGPLFMHQLSHVWIDYRELRDARNREVGFDYFENSRRATLIQRAYAIQNPHGFAHYGANGWGFTASDGPGPAVRTIDGVRREFYGYVARGAPLGPDDGTIAPWAVVASLPFAPDVVCDVIHHAIERLGPRPESSGFDGSFNPTFPSTDQNPNGWVAPWKLGLNEGPIILMIENYLSELIWSTFVRCPYVVHGLRRAGFEGGYLDATG